MTSLYKIVVKREDYSEFYDFWVKNFDFKCKNNAIKLTHNLFESKICSKVIIYIDIDDLKFSYHYLFTDTYSRSQKNFITSKKFIEKFTFNRGDIIIFNRDIDLLMIKYMAREQFWEGLYESINSNKNYYVKDLEINTIECSFNSFFGWKVHKLLFEKKLCAVVNEDIDQNRKLHSIKILKEEWKEFANYFNTYFNNIKWIDGTDVSEDNFINLDHNIYLIITQKDEKNGFYLTFSRTEHKALQYCNVEDFKSKYTFKKKDSVTELNKVLCQKIKEPIENNNLKQERNVENQLQNRRSVITGCDKPTGHNLQSSRSKITVTIGSLSYRTISSES